jgi:hypothetical protein
VEVAVEILVVGIIAGIGVKAEVGNGTVENPTRSDSSHATRSGIGIEGGDQ